MSRRNLIKAGVLLLLVAVFAAVWFSPLRDHLSRDEIRTTAAGLRALWYGPIAFILIFAIGCIVALPASIFVLAAGLIWGWVLGGTYSIVGGVLGAVASFYLGRFVGEGLLERFGGIGRVVAKQVDHAGFRSLLVLRNIPGIPFAVLNYGAGVCGVRFGDFVLATALGMAVPTFVFAYCADALINGSMTEGDAIRRMMIVGALIIGMILLPVLVKRYGSRQRSL